MLISVVRVVAGFLTACLVAGAVQTLFVVTPADLARSPDLIGTAAQLSLMAATQTAVFAAPFAVIAVGLSEWLGSRSWLTYALFGIAIALTAYAAVIASETTPRTIYNDYAFKAFLTTGFLAGFVYWMVAGRTAGGWRPEPEEAP